MNDLFSEIKLLKIALHDTYLNTEAAFEIHVSFHMELNSRQKEDYHNSFLSSSPLTFSFFLPKWNISSEAFGPEPCTN